MKLFLTICITLISLTGIGQIEWNKTEHNFGDIGAFDERYTDFVITNKGSESVYLLRIDKDREVSYIYSNKFIKPDSSITIRIKYNPDIKGKFKKKIPIYLSNSMAPTEVVIKGNITEIPADTSPGCPDFSEKTSVEEQISFEMTIKVIDEQTKEPINGATVSLINSGRPYYQWNTNRKGLIVKTIPLGYYYFIAQADGYNREEFPKYINRSNNYVLIELKRREPIPDPGIEPEPVIVTTIPSEPVDTTEDFEEIVIGEDPEPELPDTNKIVIPEIPVDTSDFSADLYAANNLVFLLDISSSMKGNGKLDLLKASMLELLTMLRPEDKLTLVSFSTGAQVIMQPTNTIKGNKAKIEEIISSLEADGSTNGTAGIKKAYRTARSNKIKGGNNQIIIATDGGFNEDRSTYYRTTKFNAKWFKIKLSVVGIKNSRGVGNGMEDLAKVGTGRYIHIDSYETALKSLKEEIKISSAKH